MKLQKNIVLATGLAVCACLMFTVLPLVAAEEPYDEDTYGPESLIVWNKPVPRVTFSHKVHTMDAGLECDSCHDDLFEMEAGAVEAKDDFTMASFTEGNYCGACHDGDTAFSTNDSGMCAACHEAPATIVFTKPVKAVIFEHKLHVDDMGFSCADCHSDLFKMEIGNAEKNPEAFIMDALYKGEYCGACHDGDQAFASDTRCTSCHIGVMGFDRLFGHPEKKTGGH